MTLINLTNRRELMRQLMPGQSVLWAVTAPTVTAEMRMLTDAAAKTGVRITQQQMITVSPKADEMPLQTILIARVE